MKSTGILFSAPMVLAIGDGRKTQSRRIVKPQPPSWANDPQPIIENRVSLHGVHPPSPCGHPNCRCIGAEESEADFRASMFTIKCPYGAAGDELWVKETFARIHEGLLQHLDPEPDLGGVVSNGWTTVYRADGWDLKDYGVTWTPSIHMPRWASRITLVIKSVRVERLQDISEEDALAEGINAFPYKESCGTRMLYGTSLKQTEHGTTAKVGYQILWESINSPGSWDANPWVWRIEFTRKEK